MNQEKIGKFILQIRQENHMSQAQFAEKLNVTSQAVSKWENGRGIPDIELLKKISNEFHLDIDEIINGERKKKENNHKFFKYISFTLFLILLISIGILFYLKNENNLKTATISSEKSDFNITGILATNQNKTTIYISNIIYSGKEEQKKYYAVESILYEEDNNNQIILGKYGSVDNFNTDNQSTHSIVELLKNIVFNVENYKDSCSVLTNHKLYIIINALDEFENVIAFRIPLTLVDNCNK